MSEILPNKKKKGIKRKWLLVTISVFLICGIVGWIWLDRWSKKYGFTGAADFTKTIVTNYWSSFDAEYETVEITINENDFNKLALQREEHLKRGIITKLDDRYVLGIITYNGKKIKCRLRLKGHMTDHLQDQKWSFRIKTAGGDYFKGMKVFTLQHPGTRNYIYEWIYHQLLEQEGIATVRYSFLNLKVNGESWGIYAVEENFAEELVNNHQLPKGPILGFNPDMYWFSRLNEHEKKSVNYDYYLFNSTYAEAYDEDENFASSEQRKDYSEAAVRLYLFATGKLKTSEVFDIDKLARFHAIIDLVGGHFSLDWSDVKYYYNPQSRKIEPVGYESFSVQNTKYLSGAFRFRNTQASLPELHDLIFSDAAFFNLYVKHLTRISKSGYLNKFFDKKETELKNNLNILYTEFPYKKLPLDVYYRNQENIKTLLKEPITHVCYLESTKNDSIRFTIGNTGSLPLEIIGMKYNDSLIPLESTLYTSARKKNEIIGYEKLIIPFQKPENFDETQLSLKVRKIGNREIFWIKVKPIEFLDQLEQEKENALKSPNVSDFDFLMIDEESKTIRILPGEHILEKDLVIPEGYIILGAAPLKITLNNGSCIYSRSAFRITGSEDSPVEICSTDSTSNRIIFTSTKTVSRFSKVYFFNLGMNTKKSETHDAIINLYESSAQFENCIFSSNARLAIQSVRNILFVNGCDFQNFDKGIKLLFANFSINHCSIGNITTSAIELKGSFGTIQGTSISDAGTGIDANDATMMKIKNISFINIQGAVKATDLSELNIEGVRMRNVRTGFEAEKKSDVFGPAKITVTNFTKSSVKTIMVTDKKSKVLIK